MLIPVLKHYSSKLLRKVISVVNHFAHMETPQCRLDKYDELLITGINKTHYTGIMSIHFATHLA